ncbi:hypothetical protein J7481_06785 [Labrenzia sp. R4_2]|uniref:hypothetical protein n=1 Tax=Labrenzia sp. R4_2 TaxID=2821107 RepID=UPI001ADCFA85|nr:hypothetical protein [Labrenzia sp. R4_2]MBO9419195.1 hypothetical protein [Labrenzia sp. R4_2]
MYSGKLRLAINCDRPTANPDRAERPLVFKTASRVQGYRARIRVPSYLMCATNDGPVDLTALPG